jgi:hypothetical protein
MGRRRRDFFRSAAHGGKFIEREKRKMRIILLATVLGVTLGMAGPARADERSDAEALLDKGIKALGGEANLTKFKAATWKCKGKIHLGDETDDFSSEWALQAPDQLRIALEVTGKQGTFKQVRVLNGDKGWIKVDNEETSELPKGTLAEEKKNMDVHWVATLVPLKDKSLKLAPLPEAKVGDRPVVGIKVTGLEGREFRLYLDKESGLPLKSEWQVKDPSGKDITQEVTYADYKDVDGIKRATKLTVQRGGKPFAEQEITDFKALEKLDDKTFAKP